jgi:CHASE2 domain-containing sensor protein
LGVRLKSRQLIIGLNVAFFISLLTSWTSHMGYLDAFQETALDVLLWIKNEKPYPESMAIVTWNEINPEDRDLFKYYEAPSQRLVNRRYLADVVRFIADCKPRTVGIDIRFDVPTEDDAALIQALEYARARSVPVVLNSVIAEIPGNADGIRYRMEYPLPEKAENLGSLSYGFINVAENHKVRAFPIWVSGERENEKHPSFPLSVMAAASGISQDELVRSLASRQDVVLDLIFFRQKAEREFETKKTALKFHGDRPLLRINFIGPAGSYKMIPAQTLHLQFSSGRSWPEDNPLKGKIVLIGGFYKDRRPVEIHSTPAGKMPGVEVLANGVYSLASRSWIKHLQSVYSFAFEFLVGVLVLLVLLRFSLLKSFLITTFLVIPGVIFLSSLVFVNVKYWADFVPVVLAVFLHGIIEDIDYKRQLKHRLKEALEKKNRMTVSG